MSSVSTLEQKEGVPWLCLRCCSWRDWLTQAMCCIHLSLFKAPWCFDLQPWLLQDPHSPLQSKTLAALTSWAMHSSVLTLHLCTVMGWVTCILSRHINTMTGHHGLQLTPPHKHLCVHIHFRTPSTASFSFCSPSKGTASHCSHIPLCSNTSRALRRPRSILKALPINFCSTKRHSDSWCHYSFHFPAWKAAEDFG